MMTEEVSAAEYRRILAGQSRKRAPRGDGGSEFGIRDSGERTGLTTLLRAGWSVQSPDAVAYRLYQSWRAGRDTGLCVSLKAACDAAKQLMKEQHHDPTD